RYARDGFGLWAIELKETGRLVGDCGPAIREVEGTPEVEMGWHVNGNQWGRGLATEAAAASRDWVFEWLGLPRVISLIQSRNVPSRRVAEKIGMSVEREVPYGSMGWLHLVSSIAN